MKLTLVKKTEEAKGTFSFFFEPEKEVKWMAGQYYYYTLPKLHYDDSRGPTRHFTISSSPAEGKLLRLTTRIREQSGYKKTLNELQVGTEVEGEGPTGTFIFDEAEKDKTHVFLAGGIGITAFRVFIKNAIDSNFKTPINLIYSNSHAEEIAFKDELEKWAKENEHIKAHFTVSKPEESKTKWKGLTGRIDEKMVNSLVTSPQSLATSTFWVVGPPPFINAMEDLLPKLNVPSDHINSEKFTGY